MYSTFKMVCGILTVFAAVCWGLMGFFNYDLMTQFFGRNLTGSWNAARIIYSAAGVAGVVMLLDLLGIIKRK